MRNISKKANVSEDCVMGFNTVIMDDVIIGANCILGNNVIVYQGTKIGKNVRIDDNAVIGKKPMVSPRSIFKEQKDFKPTVIGNNCIIGTNVIIYVQSIIGDYNLFADMSTVRENVEIGDYNIIGRGVCIENYVNIGNRNKFETNCYITAYSEIEDYCFIAPCVATSNDNFMGRDPERFKHFKGVYVKKGGRIGVNSTILPGRTIASDSAVAAGSVVCQDTEPEEIWLGSPARSFRKVPETQLLKNNLDKKT